MIGYGGLDATSRLTVRRFVVTLVVAALVASFAMAGYRLVFFTAMIGVAVAVTAALAMAARAEFNAPVLNRWDETLAYIAVSMLTL